MKDSHIYGLDNLGNIRLLSVDNRGFLRRSYYLRDVSFSALTTLSTGATGTETALTTGVAGEYHDLLYLICTNASSVAQTLTVAEATGGGANLVLQLPAANTLFVDFKDAPWPQNASGNSWTVNLNNTDMSNTTVYIQGLFVKNTV